MTPDEITPEDPVRDDDTAAPDAATSAETTNGQGRTLSRRTRALIATVTAVVVVVGAMIAWTSTSSGPPESQVPSANHASGSPSGGDAASDAPGASAPSTAEGGGQASRPGPDEPPSPFPEDAENALRGMSVDLTQVDLAIEQGAPLFASVSSLREHAVVLRSLTPPSGISERWSATLDEVDRWLGVLESSDPDGAPGQARDSTLAIDRLLTELLGLVSPPA